MARWPGAQGLQGVQDAGTTLDSFPVVTAGTTSAGVIRTLRVDDDGALTTAPGASAQKIEGKLAAAAVASGQNPVMVGASDGNNNVGVLRQTSPADALTNALSSLATLCFNQVYNGTTWDRWRDAASYNAQAAVHPGGVGPLVWDGAAWRRSLQVGAADGVVNGLPGVGILARSSASVYNSLAVTSAVADGDTGSRSLATHPQLFNETTYDRKRGNTQAVLLASAARTTTQTGAILTNHNARGILVIMTVTVASGTGGLSLRIRGGTAIGTINFNGTPSAVTTTGTFAYILYPGVTAATGSIVQATNQTLPRSFSIDVTVGDASSYTYSVEYALIV